MPYAPNLYRSNVIATVAGEMVINTVWCQLDQGTNNESAAAQIICERIRDEWAAMILGGTGLPTALAATFMLGTQWTAVNTYAVNSAGKATAQAESVFPATVKGSSGNSMPPQVALVGTLLTGAPGRSQRGRIYLGGVGSAGITATGRVSTATRDAAALGLAGFYRRVRHVAGAPDAFRPVVVSPTLGTARKITHVQVGDVYDTQRRRRNKLVEARFRATVDA